ncbi:MAG: class I SAM-dependent methyltransferase [Flavobacteriales bacterium]|nr:class I SAM-dependent methyltransferase [Flavobacteriales bacterium]MCC6937548.1 class I SAM-dependent methyltransferase [Flavobacteriales bacterium]
MSANPIRSAISRYLISKAIRRSVKLVHACYAKDGLEATIDLLFTKECELVMPWQFKEELLALATRIEAQRPKVVMEIGTATGGTLLLSCLLAADDATLISVDLPEGDFGGGYPAWKLPLYSSFAKPGQRIHLIRGDSHSRDVHQQITGVLADRRIDYLFIDGDHTYEGVKQDFETYSALVDAHGLIAFHDIAPDRAPMPNHFVSVFWNEVKQRYTHREFIKHGAEQSKWGLGLLSVDGSAI